MSDNNSIIAEISAERQRQIDVEGWMPEHDDFQIDGEIAAAAAAYILHNTRWLRYTTPSATILWPWSMKWWKPKDRRRDLIRAAAMIAAEIERLDRAEQREG